MARRFREAVLLAWLSKTARGRAILDVPSENSLLCLSCAVRIPSLALAKDFLNSVRRQNRLRSAGGNILTKKTIFQKESKTYLSSRFLYFFIDWDDIFAILAAAEPRCAVRIP